MQQTFTFETLVEVLEFFDQNQSLKYFPDHLSASSVPNIFTIHHLQAYYILCTFVFIA